jgi:hypothetical protein
LTSLARPSDRRLATHPHAAVELIDLAPNSERTLSLTDQRAE